MRRRAAAAIGAVTVVAVIGGCGVPDNGGFRQIDDQDIPYDLTATSTTTTTLPTTTTSSSTTTTLVVVASTTEPATTTTVPVESVSLFWVSGSQILPSSRLLSSPASPSQVLTALLEGPPEGDIAIGLRSALPTNVELEVTVERGIATVNLPRQFITEVPGGEQRFAIAQIVFTLTRRGGLGQVSFVVGSTPQAVPRGGGDLSEPGELLTCEDYENLLGPGLGC